MAKHKRASISRDVQTAILTASRRRCAVCFALNRDTGIKQGQIAHVDDDPANGNPENLVFLCLVHHDEYDSTRSQSKGLTAGEISRFREELHESLHAAWKEKVNFGGVSVLPPDDFSGEWLRTGEDEDDSAELKIRLLGSARLRIEGSALHGRTREFGPNMGELDFEAPLLGRAATYRREVYKGEIYTLVLRFEHGALVATETGQAPFGHNVYFSGRYERVF